MTEDRVIDKIRGLLAKAESTEYDEEASALLDKAAELMAKYRIDAALLEAADPAKADDVIEVRTVSVGTYHVAKGMLAVQLAQTFGAHVTWGSRRPGRRTLNFVGHRSDLDVVEALMTSIELQLDRELLKVKGYDAGDTRTQRASFAYGFVRRVGQRLKDHYAKAESEAVDAAEAETTGASTSVALVLASRDEKVSAKYEEIYHRKPSYTRTTYTYGSSSSQRRGQEAGSRADIGQGAVGGRRALTS